MAVRELPKDVLKMASGLISPFGLAGHCRQLCIVMIGVASPGRVVAAARAPAPHPGLRGRHQQVQRRGLLDGAGLGEGAAPHRVEHGAWGGARVTCLGLGSVLLCCVVLPVAGKAGAPSR